MVKLYGILKRFKEITSGRTIVMGRKTWESLPFKLPKRKNIVITNQTELEGKQPDIITDDIESIYGEGLKGSSSLDMEKTLSSKF